MPAEASISDTSTAVLELQIVLRQLREEVHLKIIKKEEEEEEEEVDEEAKVQKESSDAPRRQAPMCTTPWQEVSTARKVSDAPASDH